MQLTDSREISADRATVYAALLSPEVLKACVPGCEELTGSPEDGFEAKVVQKVGPVKATFKGAVTVSNLNEPESLTLSGEGKGGAAGFAKGGADVELEEDGDATILRYTAKADVGGKIAQLGSRLINSTANRLAGQFFSNFKDTVEGDA